MADLRTGLRTDETLESLPYGFRVTWIDWDSPFRDSDLQVGDLIVAVNGEACSPEDREHTAPRAVGQYQEVQGWAERGAAAGDAVTLTVLRGRDEMELAGALKEDVFHHDAQERVALGPGGPPRRSTSAEDGAFANWSGWYEDFVKRCSGALDGGWKRASFNNRRELAAHLEDAERVEYLRQHYPGPFTDTVAADFEHVRQVLAGKKVELGEADLEYRELGARRREEAQRAARRAFADFLAELEPETIPTFPAVDPIRGDVQAAVGKVVVWPWITPRGGMIERFGETYALAGSRREGFWFASLRAPEMQRFFDTFYRYRAKVDPGVAERYRFVTRILDDPILLTADDRPAPGLLVEVLGGLAGAGDGDCFVDLRAPQEGETPSEAGVGRSAFAGEAELAGIDVPELADDASPEKVVTTLIQSVKWGDETTWISTHADWRLFSRLGDHPVVDLAYRPNRGNLQRQWGEARSQVMDYLYDARVAEVGRVRALRPPDLPDGGPAVDQVDVFIDHFGRFPGEAGGDEYRSFTDSRVFRRKRLERLDGGPWRLVEPRRL